MGLRIVPDLYLTMLDAVSNDRARLNAALQEISTGRSVNSPSDNPAATAALIENTAQTNNNDQFQRSISSVQGVLETADTVLGSVIASLNQAIAVGTEGANGAISPSQQQALAQEVQSIQDTIQNLANTAYQGNYLFAGTAFSTQPFVTDPSSPSGVSYQGNNDTNKIQIGPSQYVSINLPGSTIFTASGSDVFQALHDLTTALQSGGNVAAALDEVHTAFNNLNMQRTFYGNALDELNSVNNNLSQQQLTLARETSTLISADPAKAASNLVQAEYTLNAALSAFGRISQNTLLDFLK
ncbi:MAG TPA: flagellar hook-associated protein FlgL [Terriglobia bacterium]|jgi:flagellar hook-associated protein 3 FlgL|nr:flagellar hook-associated protein FlgL [Terriglobia bacterium]